MIKIIKAGSIIALLIVIVFILKKPIIKPVIDNPEEKETKNEITNSYDFELDQKQYQIVWLLVDDPGLISLYSNFEDKLSLDQILEKHDCRLVVNAGFYSKEREPIGLFINHDGQKSDAINSSLFNGFFSLNHHPQISDRQPNTNNSIRLGLQSGPLLIINGKKIKLNLANDKYSRRIVVGLTKDKLIFLAVYDVSSYIKGPKLADLPDIILDFANQNNLEITEAINLDGGTASFFFDSKIKLSELTPVGSYFCLH